MPCIVYKSYIICIHKIENLRPYWWNLKKLRILNSELNKDISDEKTIEVLARNIRNNGIINYKFIVII